MFDSIMHEVRLPWFLSATDKTMQLLGLTSVKFLTKTMNISAFGVDVSQVADKNHGKRTSCTMESNTSVKF